jgi:tight adherence protein C
VIYLIVLLAATSVALIVGLVLQTVPARSGAVIRRLEEVRKLGGAKAPGVERAERRKRGEQRERVRALLEAVGTAIESRQRTSTATREFLTHAGFRRQGAVGMYLGIRALLPALLGALSFAVVAIVAGQPRMGILGAAFGAIVGWVIPVFYVGNRKKKRQKDLQRALPDALDLMVVCVEAGLGLNQALLRVSEEIRHVSVLMSDELEMVNLEIRAGASREEALRNLGDRTGVEDIRSLTTILIQTDRFGTSIATALRVQSDTLRDKRRQRAEEAAAKTTIKMVLPLVFCIFPALFVVILGPGAIQIYKTFSKM